MHAHPEPARPVTGRQQRQRSKLCPFTPARGAQSRPRVREFLKKRCAATLGPRKCGLSGAITAPNDRCHAITQLNARDGPAKGRTSVLIDEERVRD